MNPNAETVDLSSFDRGDLREMVFALVNGPWKTGMPTSRQLAAFGRDLLVETVPLSDHAAIVKRCELSAIETYLNGGDSTYRVDGLLIWATGLHRDQFGHEATVELFRRLIAPFRVAGAGMREAP